MNWKFWEKQEKQTGGVKLSKPKDLPSGVGKHIVVKLGYSSDWTWSLKIVTMPRKDNKRTKDFRIYDPKTAIPNNVKIVDYRSLEGLCDVILFEGWYEDDSFKLEVKDNHLICQDEAV